MRDPRALIAWTIGAVVGTGVLLGIAWLARSVLLVVYVSAILATGFAPIVRVIERQRIPAGRSWHPPRWSAILALYLLVLALVAGVAVAVVPRLVEQGGELVTNAPALLDQLERSLGRRGFAPEALRAAVERLPDRSTVIDAALATASSVLGGVLGVVTILILTFYFLVDAANIRDTAIRALPVRRRPAARAMTERIGRRVSAWLTGQLMLAALIGTSTGLVLGLLGVPYFYVLALIAAVGEFVPYAGPFLAALPGIALAASVSWSLAAWTAAFYLVQQLIENNVLVPQVMSQRVGLNPAIVLIAIMLGGALLGIPGALLAVPTAAILQVLWEETITGD